MKPLGPPPYSCLITRGDSSPLNFETEKSRILGDIGAAIADGVGMIQIREKSLPARLLLDLARSVVSLAKNTPTLIFVNDRPDIAIAARADGVHLPETSFSPAVIRRIFGDRLVIGVSSHSPEHARHAASTGADYVFFASVFDSPGKHTQGVEALQAVCSALDPFPVIALGGVDQDNVTEAMSAGAAGIAAIRALHDQRSRRDILDALRGEAPKVR